MQIIRIRYNEEMTQMQAIDADGEPHFIPYPCYTWHKELIDEFKASGGVIEPYAPPQEYWLNGEKHMLHWPAELLEGASYEKPQSIVDAERIAEIKDLLMQNDLASVRPLRSKLAGTATAEDETRLADLEAQAQSLRAELAALLAGEAA